jgi:arylsulfatase A-like enzyme
MITGLYPSWHGCWTIGVKLPEDVPTVGDEFQRNGYDCALIGKAHFQPLKSIEGSESLESYPKLRDLDYWRAFHGPHYGFNHIEIARMHADESHVGQHYAIWMEEKGLLNWRDYFQKWPAQETAGTGNDKYWEVGRQHHWDLPAEFHYTTWTAERSIARIEENVAADKPFFLWASFHDPHPPYLVPEPWASLYNPDDMDLPVGPTPDELDRLPTHFARTQEAKPDFSDFKETEHANHGLHSHRVDLDRQKKNLAIYYGMTSFMDEQIGRILDKLDALGIADNTLVVFTTDHGHFFGQHGLQAKGPFHYEDMLKLPFIVRWKGGQVPAGRVSESLQALIDLPSTFLAACGIAIPGLMQGLNQLSAWRDPDARVRAEVLVENRHQPSRVHLRTYIDQQYKLTVYRDRDFGELFDLLNDPAETRNLWNDPAAANLKCELLRRFVNAELKREPTRMPRIAHA